MTHRLNKFLRHFACCAVALGVICVLTACDSTDESAASHRADDTATAHDSATGSESFDSVTESSGGCMEEDTASGTDSDSASDSLPAGDTHSDTPTDTDSGMHGADDSASSSDSTDSDTTDADSATVSDASPCPPDMVPVFPDTDSETETAFCIDQYEASRADATADSHGSDDTVARSVPGVLPWYAHPMSADAMRLFANACDAAGKTLCSATQWEYSCSGPQHTDYVFGDYDAFNVETCNTVATFCDDYCAENDILSEDCNTSASNCGYHCGDASGNETCFKIVPTGQFSACTNMIGTFDINGNLWEIVTSDIATTGYEIRGGAFNCASPVTRLQCDAKATWTDLYAGFRCCRPIFGDK